MTHKIKGRLTRREFLRDGVGLASVLVLSGCGTPDPSPTEEMITTATVSTEVKEINLVTAVALDTPEGRLADLILDEAFKRNGIEYNVKFYPHQRCIELVNSERADGDQLRIHSFTEGGANPNHVRVEEYIFAGRFMGQAVKPGIEVDGLESLKENNYTVGCLAGINWCEVNMVGFIDDDKLNLVTSDYENGFRMLVAGRFDVFVTVPAALFILESDEFKDAGIYNAGLLAEIRVYTYLHKKHKDLAPIISASIAEMRAEGLIDEYIEQVEEEFAAE